MKTTLHLHRGLAHAPTAPPERATGRSTDGRTPGHSTTLRLGLVVSLVAAILAIVIEAVVQVPAILILVPVVVVGFALSWHASGRDTATPQRR